ncbi:HpcH/HpaI aldolase family protein [Cupriavidus sp. TMH.W2]|uniref:HpcH/HpaI aldolase family protein n=1 Tax=Cupriavidus sp. TMH.W2 TaxID=3434465 RepID=UPI003D771C0B
MQNNDPAANAFRARLATGQVPIGTWLMSGASSTAEALGYAGFDWLVIDMEHVPVEFRDTLQLLQAVDCSGAIPVVRLAANDPVLAKRALDMGARTLMFPFVQDAEEARRAVSSVKYPPQGMRGYAAMHRGSRYGTWSRYGTQANDATVCIVQLETPEAVSRLEEIAAVPGVDALFIGPGDLSAALGNIGNIGHAEVQKMIRDAARRARAAGVPIGIVGPTPEMVSTFIDAGYHFVAVASDMGMMMRQASAFLAAFNRQSSGPANAGPY